VTSSIQQPVVVLVHGAWHDLNTWNLVVPLLAQAGIDSRALTMPSTDPSPSLPSLTDDIAAVVDLIDRIPEREVILCGHSYGGMVIAGAGHHPRVRNLVFLAAFCPEEGESVFDLAVGNPPPLTAQAVQVRNDGTMVIDPALARETFYGDVDADTAAQYVGNLRSSTAAVFTDRSGSPAWKLRPTTYVVCEQDRAISVDRCEQMAARATADVRRLQTSHSPFFSRPDLVAEFLAGIAQAE
jgi:pimeloyl-ACP methyl ester carboxylesterase